MDTGCGTGRLTAKLLDRLPDGHVVAVDLSHNMLTQAAEHLRSFGSRITLVQADLTHLPFISEFDVVFSTASFHWVLDHEAMLASLARSLRPGGKIEAQCGGGANLHDVHRRVKGLMQSPKYARYFEHWKHPWEFANAEVTKSRMEGAGFVEVETWLEHAPLKLASAEEYRQFVGPVILRPFMNAISDAKLREEFCED